MNTPGEELLAALIDAQQPHLILNVGDAFSSSTLKLLFDGEVISIDPARDSSIEAIRELSVSVDLVIIDGDHNWYTVLNELRVLEKFTKRCKNKFPLVLLGHTLWPYGRRDSYIDPHKIPAEHLHENQKSGLQPGQHALASSCGLDSHIYHAKSEHALRSGVLTAIEDFLAETKSGLELLNLPVDYGFGILSKGHHRSEGTRLNALLSELKVTEPLFGLMASVERNATRLMVEIDDTAKAIIDREEEVATWTHREGMLQARNQELRAAIESMKDLVAAANESVVTEDEHIAKSVELDELLKPKRFAYQRKFKKLKRDPVGFLQDSAVGSILPIPSKRKLDKLARDPAGFIRDSPLGLATSRNRKFNKLTRNPVAFLQDSAVGSALSKTVGVLSDVTEPVYSKLPSAPPQFTKKLRKLTRDPTSFVRDARLLAWHQRQLKADISLIAASPFFDLALYREQCSQKLTTRHNAIRHYVRFGGKEGFNPHPNFDGAQYLLANPDVRRAGLDPLLHYLRYGASEGRKIYATQTSQLTPSRLRSEMELIRTSKWFSAEYYNETNSDVCKPGLDPLEHFVTQGWRERRCPSEDFDVEFYLQQNADVRIARVNPLYHFLRIGAEQGRQPNSGSAAQDRLAIEVASEWVKSATKTFSVVMPTWNRLESITNAIATVLNQSYPHVELVISDDGSTDGTSDFIKQTYAEQIASGQIVYLENQHYGVSAARNAGLQASTGQWIAYLDSDNTWREDYLLLMGHALASNPDRHAAYAKLAGHDRVNGREFTLGRYFHRDDLLNQNFIDLNIYVHDRELYERLGGFDETLKRLVDWDMILRHLHNEDPVYVPHLLCDYYLDKSLNNITHTQPLEGNMEAVRKNTEKRNATLPQRKLIRTLAYLSDTHVLENRDVEFETLRSLGYEVSSFSYDNPGSLQAAIGEGDLDWIHADGVALSGVLQMIRMSSVTGYSLRPSVEEVFAPPRRSEGAEVEIDLLKQAAQERRCKAIFVENELQEQVLVSRGVPRHKVLRVPSAFSWNSSKRDTEISQRDLQGPLQVLAMGPLHADSGISNLVEACANMPTTVRLQISGSGSQEPLLRSQITSLGASNISLIPIEESRDRRAQLFAQADLFAFPYAPSSHSAYHGMPTLILEACAQNTPLMATRSPATNGHLRDGVSVFTIPAADTEAITARLKEIVELSPACLSRVADNARQELEAEIGTVLNASALDCMMNPAIDIVMVATDDIAWRHFTLLVDDLFIHTSLPFTLHVVDNGCSAENSEQIRLLTCRYPNVEVYRFGKMVGLGVASNRVFEKCTGRYIIYICANEGAVVGRGWERSMVNFMVLHDEVALGGTLVSSPQWLTGAEYTCQPWFHKFRKQEFAYAHPKREFAHIQGGLYILRRKAFEEFGGFHLPHNHMDVEYSYYLESKGARIAEIPSILSLSAKTRPKFHAHLDERVRAVHPVIHDDERGLLASIGNPFVMQDSLYCNIRGEGVRSVEESLCSGARAETTSTGFTRAVYRYLALSGTAHRGLTLRAHILDDSLWDWLGASYGSVERLSSANELVKDAKPVDVLLVADASSSWRDDLDQVFATIAPGGLLLVSFVDPSTELQPSAHLQYQIEQLPYQSTIAKYGLKAIYAVCRNLNSDGPHCNVCGGFEFGAGPGGRTSAGGVFPRCTRCQSLERHRASRAFWNLLPDSFLEDCKALQFSTDRGVNPARFKRHEISVYGGENSLDLQAIDRPNNSYELIICNHVLEHVADDVAAVSELLRVVTTTGWVMLSVPDPVSNTEMNDWGWPDETQHGHYRVYNLDGLVERIHKADTKAQILLIPTQDPVTGQYDCAMGISRSAETLAQIADNCAVALPDGHPFKLEILKNTMQK